MNFRTEDRRVREQLLVRLDFVATWAARRTLKYYKVIREIVDSLYEEYYETAWNPYRIQIKEHHDPSNPIVRKDLEEFEILKAYLAELKSVLDTKGPAGATWLSGISRNTKKKRLHKPGYYER